MKNYLLIIPIAFLVAFGQLLVKWRASSADGLVISSDPQTFVRFVSDPVIMFAYAAGFIANLCWLYVVTKLPLTTAFPAYLGITFIMVLLGGWIFLAETLNLTKIVAVFFIIIGVVLAVNTDA